MNLTISEIYKTIQGETTYAGFPCVMVRLSGCNLICSYCDTRYSHKQGKSISLKDIIKKIIFFQCRLINITGGEPLLQEGVYPLTEKLLKMGYTILLETNGSINAARLIPDVIKIIDIKCPDSGMHESFYWENLEFINQNDEIKFVISSKKDFSWSMEIINRYSLKGRCQLLFSPVSDKIAYKKIAAWIMKEDNIRMQIQMHKVIGVR